MYVGDYNGRCNNWLMWVCIVHVSVTIQICLIVPDVSTDIAMEIMNNEYAYY